MTAIVAPHAPENLSQIWTISSLAGGLTDCRTEGGTGDTVARTMTDSYVTGFSVT
jgi:hypothetical protein